MQRILIADSSRMLAEGIGKQLEKDFLVKICCDGRRVLRQVIDFEPDILVLDMAMPGCDAISLLHNIRLAGGTENVIVLSGNFSMPVQRILGELGVVYAFTKPCAAQNVSCFVRQLALGEDGLSSWNVETELDNMLLRLGFRCRGGYDCTYEAVYLRYSGESGYLTKCLYADVRKICGKKNSNTVEKAIRDAIKFAWENGDPEIWELYFPQGRECPTNEAFISRAAKALQNREKLKKPCKMEVLKEKEA